MRSVWLLVLLLLVPCITALKKIKKPSASRSLIKKPSGPKRALTKVTKSPAKSVVQEQPPCCSDLVGTLTCRRLRKNNKGVFRQRCAEDVDFSLLQCCATCGLEQAGHRHGKFFHDGELSQHCFDRHGRGFCEAFLLKKDVWSPSRWSCNGAGTAQLAFRVCRRSCGFCRADLYEDDRTPVPKSPLPLSCHPNQHKWTEAVREMWRQRSL